MSTTKATITALLAVFLGICLGSVIWFSASSSSGTDRYPIVMKGRWGYINSKGKVVIPTQYDWAGPFRDGLGQVKKSNGKIGYIDKEGKLRFQTHFDDAGYFSDGLAYVRVDGKCGYIDTDGHIQIPATFQERFCSDFHDGYAAISLDDENSLQFHPSFFIDKTAKHLNIHTKDTALLALDFSEGVAWVRYPSEL